MSHSAQLIVELTVLVLAVFLGIEVISKVPTLLHTPLMSGTNAIHGIVIVDLAAESGGNCESTKPGEVVDVGGVTVIGLLNIPSSMPGHASQLYARNVSALLEHLAPGGELTLDWDDEITAGACVTRKEQTP